MTIEERLGMKCGICGKQRSEHIGRVFACPGGYGTSWSPDGKPDPRLFPTGVVPLAELTPVAQRNAEAIFNHENLWVIGVIIYGHPSDPGHVALLELFAETGAVEPHDQFHTALRQVKDRAEALAYLRGRGWKIQGE